MPLRLQVTGAGLRITGAPREPGPTLPLPPPAGALLATETNDLLVTEAGELILVEPS